VVIANALLEAGATVAAYDPVAMEEAKHQLGDRITYANEAYVALEGADALLLVTEWREFRMPNWDRVKEAMQTPVVIDGRNIFDAKALRDQGFVYQGIGIQ
jgi:UDPglucose 6-dehydrogenase